MAFIHFSRMVLVLPRQLRIECEGAIWPVMNRGDRQEDMVVNDADRELFGRTLNQKAIPITNAAQHAGLAETCVFNRHRSVGRQITTDMTDTN